MSVSAQNPESDAGKGAYLELPNILCGKLVEYSGLVAFESAVRWLSAAERSPVVMMVRPSASLPEEYARSCSTSGTAILPWSAQWNASSPVNRGQWGGGQVGLAMAEIGHARTREPSCSIALCRSSSARSNTSCS